MKHYLVAASTIGIAASAFATVETKLYADTYVVKDGAGATAKFYAVLDVYAKGSHLADTVGNSVFGLTSHSLIVQTSKGVANTSDIFVHSTNTLGAGGTNTNGWLPTDTGAKRWDSFIAAGNRAQGAYAKVTNRYVDPVTGQRSEVIDHGIAGNWTAASGFSQMGVPGSNFINQGTNCGWYSSKGGGAYSSAAASENPFARVSLYNSAWNSTYGDLYRGTGDEILKSKGTMQAGAANATTAWSNWAGATPTAASLGAKAGGVQVLEGSNNLGANGGASLDFHWMLGRFAIDVTGMSGMGAYEQITLQVQFNMVGKNGSGTNNETGATFTGATNAAYKVSNHFAFAVPAPGAGALLAAAGLIGRRRKA